MVVEPVHGGQEVQKAQQIKNRDSQNRSEGVSSIKPNDSVEISGGAREAAKVQQAIDIVKSAPDHSRKEKVEAAKERILGGNYLTPQVVDDIAEKIAKVLLK